MGTPSDSDYCGHTRFWWYSLRRSRNRKDFLCSVSRIIPAQLVLRASRRGLNIGDPQDWLTLQHLLAAIDHCTAECVGIHVVKKATRFEALEPIRQGVHEQFGVFSEDSAVGLRLRHDHGSVYMSDDSQNETRFLGIEPSPAFVRQPQGNGCIERFFRTLKEQLLWIRHFRDLEELRTALIEFRNRYNHQWILQRLNYRTPVQARHDFTFALQAAA